MKGVGKMLRGFILAFYMVCKYGCNVVADTAVFFLGAFLDLLVEVFLE
jgi:hypothetical protein